MTNEYLTSVEKEDLALDDYTMVLDVNSSRASFYNQIMKNLELNDEVITSLSTQKTKMVQYFLINRYFRKDSAEISSDLKEMFDIRDRLDNINNMLLTFNRCKISTKSEISKYGDKFTDLSIVNEMLDSLPNNVWTKPNRKWFNPANGIGNYTIGVILRLMEGLKEWEPKIEKRYQHIVENMIYVCEIQPYNMLMYMTLIDPNAQYKLNFYCGSFLTDDFNLFMKNIWNIRKFNMSVGNPPINDQRGDNNRSKDLYQQFVTKSRMISNNVMMITPAKWFVKEYYSEKFRYDMVNDFNIKYLFRYDDNKYLTESNVKSGFCYFLLTENKNDKIKIHNINPKIKSRPITVKHKYLADFLNKHNILPNLIDDRVFRLVRKVEKLPNIHSLYNSAYHFEIETNSKRLKNCGKHKCFVSSQKGYIKYVDFVKENTKLNQYKLLIPAASNNGRMDENYYTRMETAYPNEVCNWSFIFFDFETEEEMFNFKSYMESDFVSFLIRLRKLSQHLNKDTLSWVPLVPLDRQWTNEMVYDYFKISKTDRKFIHKTVKDDRPGRNKKVQK